MVVARANGIKTDSGINSLPPLKLGGLNVERLTQTQAVARADTALAGEAPPLALAFCNAHTAMLAFDDQAFQRALADMLVLNDGIGVEIAAKILSGTGFPANLNGTDFVPALLAAQAAPQRIYWLGGKPGVAADAARKMEQLCPQHSIAGVHDGYFGTADEPAIVSAIRNSHADILLVAMGNPRQEMFIAAHKDALGCKLMIGVGALFDFLGERVTRAPEWVRDLHAEWLYRLSREPGRLLHRYSIELTGFLLAVVRLRLRDGAQSIDPAGRNTP